MGMRLDRRHSVLRRTLFAALATGFALPLAAEPFAVIETGADVPMPAGVAVLDIRDEDTCFDGAPPKSRCLPAEQLLYSDAGEPLGFHALRWALGALGLTGAEKLVVYSGEEVARDDVLAAAALLHLAGQAKVLIHEGPAMETRDGAQVRGLWREVIYTAPMRTGPIRLDPAAEGSLRARLKTFAEGGDAVAFAPGH